MISLKELKKRIENDATAKPNARRIYDPDQHGNKVWDNSQGLCYNKGNTPEKIRAKGGGGQGWR